MSETIEVIQVQGPVSRVESVRQRLANASWQSGTSTFVASGVPFSFTTGPVLAECVCDLVAFLDEGQSSQGQTLHDVGAGTGYLTRQVMTSLARRSPDLARSCRYVASDYSAEMVEAIRSVCDALPTDLQSQLTVRMGSGVSAEDIVEESPTLVLMSYLADVIPPDHIARFEQNYCEVHAETFVVSGQTVVDASVWPPRLLMDQELAEVLMSSPDSLSSGAILQVLPLLVEGAVEGPALTNYTVHADTPFLNGRADFANVISEVVKRMGEESLVVVTDFGYSGTQAPTEFEALMTEYGAAACYAVFFDELVAAAESAGGVCHLHSVTAGGTQVLVIYKGSRNMAFADRFADIFSSLDPDHDGLNLFSNGEAASLAEVEAVARKIDEVLSGGGVPAYASLANLAHLFAVYAQEEKARAYALLCDQHFGLVAAPEHLLLGDLASKRGEADEALGWYEKARATAPSYGPTHIKVAGVYLASELYPDYGRVMKDYVRITDEPITAHLKWLTEKVGQELESVPADVMEEFRQICQSEFGNDPS